MLITNAYTSKHTCLRGCLCTWPVIPHAALLIRQHAMPSHAALTGAVAAQGLPGSLPWGMMLTYFNDYLSYDRGLSMDKATTVILFFGFGAAAGALGC